MSGEYQRALEEAEALQVSLKGAKLREQEAFARLQGERDALREERYMRDA